MGSQLRLQLNMFQMNQELNSHHVLTRDCWKYPRMRSIQAHALQSTPSFMWIYLTGTPAPLDATQFPRLPSRLVIIHAKITAKKSQEMRVTDI
jgi:hypothetical protein